MPIHPALPARDAAKGHSPPRKPHTPKAQSDYGSGFLFSVKTIGMSRLNGRKPCSLRAALRHNRRAIPCKFVTWARTHLNETLLGLGSPEAVHARALSLLPPGKRRVDYVQAVEFVFSLPATTTLDVRRHFVRCVEWMAEHFGHANILSADIHLDESHPHCHVLLSPVVDGRVQGSKLICKPRLSALRKSFTEQVMEPHRVQAALPHTTAEQAPDLAQRIVQHLESTQDAVTQGTQWDTIKASIERDPATGAAILRIDLETLETDRHSDQSLSCVELGQGQVSASPTQADDNASAQANTSENSDKSPTDITSIARPARRPTRGRMVATGQRGVLASKLPKKDAHLEEIPDALKKRQLSHWNFFQ